MRRNFLKHLVSKAQIIFLKASRAHVSQPLRRMEVTKDLKELKGCQQFTTVFPGTLDHLAQEPSSEARVQLTHGWGTVSGCSDMSMDPRSSHVEALQRTWHSWVSNRSCLLLDWLPTKAAESSLLKDVWLFRGSRRF